MKQSPSPRSFRRSVFLFVQTAATRILGIGSSALLMVLLTRSLTPADYGAYALLSTTAIFANLLLGLGLSLNLTRRVPGAADAEASALVATFIPAEMAVGGIILGAFLALRLDRALAGALDVSKYRSDLRLVLCATWIDLGAAGCLNYLMARKRFGAGNVLSLLRGAALGPLLVLGWLFWRRIDIHVIALAWLGGAIVSLSYGLAATGLVGHWRRFDRGVLRNSLFFGLMVGAQSFTFYFLKLADRYILARFVPLHDIGIYSFAYTLCNVIYSLTALVLVGLYHPHAVEAHNRGDLKRRDMLLAQLTRVAFAAIAVAALVMALFSRQLIFFTPAAYLESARVMPWVILTLIPVVAAYAPAIVLMLEGRPWVSVVAGVAAIAVAVPLNLLLVPRFSYYGSLIASVVGFSMVAAIQHFVARSWRFIDPRNFAGLHDDLRSALRDLRGRSTEASQATGKVPGP
ncbi:MAG: lipopolysaccharide biosynthesis protein [Myxococcales bacterium]